MTEVRAVRRPTKGRRRRRLSARSVLALVAIGVAVGAGPLIAVAAIDGGEPAPDGSGSMVVEGDGARPLRGQERIAAIEREVAKYTIPAGTSMDHVDEGIADGRETADGVEFVVAYNAGCLWWQAAVEEDLSADEAAAIKEVLDWPAFAPGTVDPSFREVLAQATDRALAGDTTALRRYAEINCAGPSGG